MCNNILQYGHLYAWGRKHNRPTLSMRFAYKYPYFHINETANHNFLRYLIGKYGAKSGLIPVVQFNEKDGDTREQEQIMLTRRNVVAEGWEARFYPEFIEYFDEIKALFAFNAKVRKSVGNYLAQNGGEHTTKVGIHIRRGDYSRWQGGKFFYTDAQYLGVMRSIAEYICSKTPGEECAISFYVCGNDPALDESTYEAEIREIAIALNAAGNHCRLTVNFPKGNPGEDLCLLSECNLLAGPPSTFTLVASMYREMPLYWIKEPSKSVSEADFGHFRELFRNIL